MNLIKQDGYLMEIEKGGNMNTKPLQTDYYDHHDYSSRRILEVKDPHARLLTAIIEQAVKDLINPKNCKWSGHRNREFLRSEAEDFFFKDFSPFSRYASLLGLNVTWLREQIKSYRGGRLANEGIRGDSGWNLNVKSQNKTDERPDVNRPCHRKENNGTTRNL